MRKHLCLLFICFLTTSAPSWAVTLVRNVVVDTPYISLGHIFKDIQNPDKAKRRLFVTPQPGKKVTLSAQLLEKIARSHKLPWRAKSHLDSVVVTGAFELIGYDDVLKVTHAAIEKEMMGQNFKIDIDQKDIKIYFPVGKVGDIEVDELQFGRNRTVFFGRIKKIENGQPTAVYRIQGKITPIVAIPTLRRILKQGEIIQASDLHWIEVPTHYVQKQTLTQEEDLIGTTPRQGTLRENVPLSKSDVYRPLTISKGEMVTLQAKTGSMHITSKGKALENGLTGQAIRIMNLASNRTIYATVTAPKTAEVHVANIKTLG